MSQEALRPQDRLADRIRLHRQADPRPVIVGEGDADQRFIARVFPSLDFMFFRAGPRDNVLGAARDVHALGIDRVVCLVDRDFDDAVATAEDIGLPVVVYDDADLEGMLWNSDALDDLLREFGSTEKLRAFGGVARLRIVTQETLAPLQRLRRANVIHKWGLEFDGVEFRRKISIAKLTMSRQTLCDALWNPELGVDKRDLYEAAKSFEVATCPMTGRSRLRGRDALAVTGVALRRLVGNVSFQESHPERLAKALRLAATEKAVADTAWYTAMIQALGSM